MPTILELGQKTKAKYPEYADMSDLEVGQKVKSKYPNDYSDFTDVPQRDQMKSQGLPVSVNPEKAEPTTVGNFIRGATKIIPKFAETLSAAARGFSGDSQEEINKGTNYPYWGNVKPISTPGQAIGVGLEASSYIPIAKGAQLGYQGLKTLAKGGAKEFIKKSTLPLMAEGAGSGFLGGTGMGLQEDKSVLQSLGQGAVSAGAGALLAPTIGTALPVLGGATRSISKGIQNKVSPTTGYLSTQLDSHIRDIFKGTTTDIGKINESAFKAKKGLELLQKESDKLKIPDLKAPLGKSVSKPFNLQKSSPNELLSAVLEMDKKIASRARMATEKATEAGLKLDTSEAQKIIHDNIGNGTIPKATGTRLLRQIESIQNNPTKMHDWVQEVNTKFKKKYERGTIEDTNLGKIADDIAENFRTKLDSIVDRKGYAEAFGNNQELKRMLVAVAKKANKAVNFGDITTDAGLDLGISVLTGNPLYMARTVGSGLFRGLVSKFRNTAGLRSFKKAGAIASKLPTKTKLPSNQVKKQAIKKNEEDIVIKTQKNEDNIKKDIFKKLDDANIQDLQGSHINSVDNIYRSFLKAQENNVPFPVEKLSERMIQSYKSSPWYQNRIPMEEILKYGSQPKVIQPPTIPQTNISKTTTIDGNIANATPNIIKTPQKSNAVISPTIPLTKPKVNLLDKFKAIPNKQGGFATGIGYKETGNLTTKILKDLEGKTTVSKQYILDATNRGELKQVERDITRQVLDTIPDGQINVKEFADKVKSELLPLKRVSTIKDGEEFMGQSGRYENIALPEELRGPVYNYSENIYTSPIATSAGGTHFPNTKGSKNYFGHTRVEDMADSGEFGNPGSEGKTRRVIEVQSDLYQKGNLERELEKGTMPYKSSTQIPIEQMRNNGYTEAQIQKAIKDTDGGSAKIVSENQKRISKLQQYNDPTAHFRMIREEIKKASQDDKTKLQFPTGETAMKIEGLGENINFYTGKKAETLLKSENLKVGQEIFSGSSRINDEWIITDVLGDGKFKAVPKDNYIDPKQYSYSPDSDDAELIAGEIENMNRMKEEFDISGKVDTNNPIYKFYEKDVQKYLNKFGGKRVVDDKGVSWIEIPITKEQGKAPVEAFGKAQLGVVGVGALGSLGALGAMKGYNEIRERLPNKPPKLK